MFAVRSGFGSLGNPSVSGSRLLEEEGYIKLLMWGYINNEDMACRGKKMYVLPCVRTHLACRKRMFLARPGRVNSVEAILWLSRW